MDPREYQIAQEVIAAFSEQNSTFGLNTLMGRIIGLLFISEDPQSLDDMSEKLDMSKGPISQVCRRLKDNNLIEKVWVPGDRKDYYQAAGDLFGRMFANQKSKMERNMRMAERLGKEAEEYPEDQARHISNRMQEMKQFFALLDQHNERFLEEWKKQYYERFSSSS
jgi:DNA-binding transcriptional regulator GbsR (MarR family)